MTMKWSVRCGVLVVVTAVSAVMAGDPVKEPPKGPTPTDEKVPTVNYIVASPRAYLAGAATERAIDYSAMTGAAENFARPALRKARVVEVPVGTRVVFSLDPEAEAVWMQGAHGMIRTLLTLQQLVVKDCAECDAGAAADADEAAPPDDSKREYVITVQGRDGNDVAPPPDPNDKTRTRTPTNPTDPNDKVGTRRPENPARWITLTTDGARDIRFGPSLGYAGKVNVPVRFDKTGVYCLRGVISTSVKSWHPRAAAKTAKNRADEKAQDTDLRPDNLLAIDVDIVHICVRVVDQLAKDVDTGKTATDPNEAPNKRPVDSKESQEETTDKDTTQTRDMVKITDAEALDLSEDGLGDLGVLVGERAGDFVLPAKDEYIGN